MVLAATGPALAAGLVVRWAGLRRLPLVEPAGWLWYALAGGLPLISTVGARLLAQWVPHPPTPTPLRGAGFSWFLLLSGLTNPWEELGWRGFALRRLQALYPAAQAALVVGVLWALWHLPLFLLPAGPLSMADKPVVAWVAGVLAQPFILTWLFNRAAGSLPVVMLYHVAANACGAWLGVPSEWALTALKVALAAGLWSLAGPVRPAAPTSAGLA